jgi:hypothetical protein
MLPVGTDRIVASQAVKRHDFYLHHHVQTPHAVALGRSQFTVEVLLRTY